MLQSDLSAFGFGICPSPLPYDVHGSETVREFAHDMNYLCVHEMHEKIHILPCNVGSIRHASLPTSVLAAFNTSHLKAKESFSIGSRIRMSSLKLDTS